MDAWSSDAEGPARLQTRGLSRGGGQAQHADRPVLAPRCGSRCGGSGPRLLAVLWALNAAARRSCLRTEAMKTGD